MATSLFEVISRDRTVTEDEVAAAVAAICLYLSEENPVSEDVPSTSRWSRAARMEAIGSPTAMSAFDRFERA
ncbi:MAG: hypothetical protein ACRDFX_01510 [Chloroflexota bacterium]